MSDDQGSAVASPILDGPYDNPSQHFEISLKGPTGQTLRGRRPSKSFVPVAGSIKGHDGSVQDMLEFEGMVERRAGREGVFHDFRKQVEAYNVQCDEALPRMALKMATGSGKTVVTAMLIAWQTLNRVAAPRDARFVRRFLVVAPHSPIVRKVHSEASHAAPSRVAVALGSQYGTVSPNFIKGAAKEAIRDDGIDLEPRFAAVEGERLVGRLPVLFVRMNGL